MHLRQTVNIEEIKDAVIAINHICEYYIRVRKQNSKKFMNRYSLLKANKSL